MLPNNEKPNKCASFKIPTTFFHMWPESLNLSKQLEKIGQLENKINSPLIFCKLGVEFTCNKMCLTKQVPKPRQSKTWSGLYSE